MKTFDRLSEHFTFSEFVRSSTAKLNGIDNWPLGKEAIIKTNLQELVSFVLEPLRVLICQPIFITSGYRCKELNRLLKGSKNSQHMTGEAADISTYDVYGNMVMVIELLCSIPKFDQLIMYRQTRDKYNFAWLHVSFRSVNNRRQVMMCCNGEYRNLGIQEQQSLVIELAEQVTLHDDTLKEKNKPSKLKYNDIGRRD